MGRGNTQKIGKKIDFPMPTAKNRFQILNLHLKKHIFKKNMVLNQKITPIFPIFFRFRRFFQIFSPIFLTICLILGFSNPPPHKTPDSPRVPHCRFL